MIYDFEEAVSEHKLYVLHIEFGEIPNLIFDASWKGLRADGKTSEIGNEQSNTYVLEGFISSTRRSKECLVGVAADTVEEL